MEAQLEEYKGGEYQHRHRVDRWNAPQAGETPGKAPESATHSECRHHWTVVRRVLPKNSGMNGMKTRGVGEKPREDLPHVTTLSAKWVLASRRYEHRLSPVGFGCVRACVRCVLPPFGPRFRASALLLVCLPPSPSPMPPPTFRASSLSLLLPFKT